ncbi:MAG: YdcF family protein [Candidatus Paceibacterota bacterium]
MDEVNKYAKIIWDYMLMHQDLKPVDAIFVLGSTDLRVAERAAYLYLQGHAPFIICSGGFGKISKFNRPEAVEFSDVIIEMGVPADKILIEDKASNTGENILFTKKILEEKNIKLNSIIAVQKPYMERRTFATIKKQWPEIDLLVTSPLVSYEEWGNQDFIEVMVGDLERIKEYPKLGFQIEQDIPDDVWQAHDELVKLGFDKYKLK